MKSIKDDNVLLEVENQIRKDKKSFYLVFILISKRGMNLHTVYDIKFKDIEIKEDGSITIGMDYQGNRDANVNIIFPQEDKRIFMEYLQDRYREISYNLDDAYVFGNKKGGRMQEARFSGYLQEIAKKLDIGDLNSRELKKISENQKYDHYIFEKNRTESNNGTRKKTADEYFKEFVALLADIEEAKIKSTNMVLYRFNELCQEQKMVQIKELYKEIQEKYLEIYKLL